MSRKRPHDSSDHHCLTQLLPILQVISAQPAQALNFMKCSHLLLVKKLSRNDSMEWEMYSACINQIKCLLGRDLEQMLRTNLTWFNPACISKIEWLTKYASTLNWLMPAMFRPIRHYSNEIAIMSRGDILSLTFLDVFSHPYISPSIITLVSHLTLAYKQAKLMQEWISDSSQYLKNT